MVNVAVLGYGTIGSGVVEVLQTNTEVIAQRAGEEEISLEIRMQIKSFMTMTLLIKMRMFRLL
jgi:homoserine dehydrogenase